MYFGFRLDCFCSLVIGFSIATFKIPESPNWEITKKNGGEAIDDVIIRAIKFKMRKKYKKVEDNLNLGMTRSGYEVAKLLASDNEVFITDMKEQGITSDITNCYYLDKNHNDNSEEKVIYLRASISRLFL